MAPESRDEVRQRIESLYDRAENETGNFNATRAMAAVTRSRGVPLAKRAGRRPEPALDEMTRQWFDAARAKLGPTVPAALPADRLPDRSPAPARSRELSGGTPAARRPLELERSPARRAVAELPAGGSAQDTPSDSGRAALPVSRKAELPGGQEPAGSMAPGPPEATAVLAPVVPAPATSMAPGAQGVATLMTPGAQGEAAWTVGGAQLGTGAALMAPAAAQGAPVLMAPGVRDTPLGRGPAATGAPPVTEPPAVPAAPVREPRTLPVAAVPGRPSLAASKASNQRKLAAASDVLSRYAARHALPATAVPAAPVTTDPSLPAPARPDAAQAGAARTGWVTGQWQQAQWGPTPGGPAAVPQEPAGTLWPDAAAAAVTTASFPPAAFTAPGPGPAPYPAAPMPVAEAGPLQPPIAPAPLTGPGTTDPGSGPIPYPAVPATPSSAPSRTAESSRAARAATAIAFARGQIGKPCVWGAMGPGSYDCSSLTQAAWRSAGVTLPRAAHEQALAGAPVTLAGAEPGDLVLFFDDDRHVGLYVGGGMMVHAPGPGSTIREESIYGAGEAAIHRIVRPA
jgi:cell wall-associated NlpC family hydrolase